MKYHSNVFILLLLMVYTAAALKCPTCVKTAYNDCGKTEDLICSETIVKKMNDICPNFNDSDMEGPSFVCLSGKASGRRFAGCFHDIKNVTSSDLCSELRKICPMTPIECSTTHWTSPTETAGTRTTSYQTSTYTTVTSTTYRPPTPTTYSTTTRTTYPTTTRTTYSTSTRTTYAPSTTRTNPTNTYTPTTPTTYPTTTSTTRPTYNTTIPRTTTEGPTSPYPYTNTTAWPTTTKASNGSSTSSPEGKFINIITNSTIILNNGSSIVEIN